MDPTETLSDPAAALAAAVQAGDATRAAELLGRHPELKSKIDDPLPDDEFGTTPLLCAVSRGSREMIEVLLDAGADVNARSHWWAGSFGVLDGVAGKERPGWLAPFLIERGAVVDVHAAAALGRLDRLAALLTADPTLVHARGGDGQTPLHCAAKVEIAQFLLDRGADIDARDIDHESTPAQYMVGDRQEVARHLVARGCRTDLLLAAALGGTGLVLRHLDADPACIRLSVSLQHFPKRNPRSGGTIYIWTLGWNKTAHLVARHFGHEDVFELLMARSPPELKLTVACEAGDEALVKALLAQHSSLVQTLTETDRRKLAVAAQDDNLGAVRLLLAAGWPLDVRGQHGGTPLHWAAWHGNAEMVREMLRYDPPLDVRGDDWNLTPLGWALHGSLNGWHRETGDYAGTVEALLQAGAAAPPWTDDLQASEPVRAVLQAALRTSERASLLEQPEAHHDQGTDQQQVDERAGEMKTEIADGPQDEENQRAGPEH